MRDREYREQRKRERRKYRTPENNAIAGLLLLIVGGALLLKEFPNNNIFSINTSDNPWKWLFTWPMIPILFGLFIGIRHNFRDFGWLIFVGVGFYFLVPYLDKDGQHNNFRGYLIPAGIILIGLVLLLRPRRRIFYDDKYLPGPEKTDIPNESEPVYYGSASVEDVLDVVSIFGGIKKNVLSKNFKGGDIVSIFGGSEINLTQADFNKKIVIDTVQIFGGTTLIIPSNWQIRSEAVTIFGGIEDKRTQLTHSDPERVLVLKGFTMFGGLEIKSY